MAASEPAAGGDRDFAPGHDEILSTLSASENYNGWLFARARPYLGPRVLDVGAGIGTFTALAADEAEQVVALEPDPDFARLLRERFAGSSRVRVAELEVEKLDPQAVGDEVDSAVCFNVLEHVPDDRDALVRIGDVLRPGGRLLLLVPAHPLLYGELDRSIGHVRRYRRRALGALLEGAGFQVETLRYVNPAGAVGWFVSTRVLRRSSFPFGGMRLFDRLVPLLRPLDRIPVPFGLSLWAVARRL